MEIISNCGFIKRFFNIIKKKKVNAIKKDIDKEDTYKKSTNNSFNYNKPKNINKDI